MALFSESIKDLLTKKYKSSEEKPVLHKLPVQCTLEVIIFRILTNVIGITHPQLNNKRIAKVGIILYDLLLLITQSSSSFEKFQHRLNRHMMLGILLEIQYSPNKSVVIGRVIHHLMTIYMSNIVQNKKIVRDSIQSIELANLFSIPIFCQSVMGNDSRELSLLFHRYRFRAQLVSRSYVLINAICSLRHDDNVYTKREIFIFTLLQMISIQEIYFAYTTYKSIKSESL